MTLKEIRMPRGADDIDELIRSGAKVPEPVPIGVSPEDWMEQFELSEEEIAEMEDAEFIIEGLIIAGHVTVIAAMPGKGKTTIAMFEAGNVVKAGYRVMYVNMDCGAADVKYWYRQAREGGFRMITPHFNGAEGIDEWLKGVREMVNSGVDLSGLVIFIDTLKKIADLMSKAKVRSTMHLLRALSARGGTVVCLAHCNKHRDQSGCLIFEGTGDIMSDCDNMLYIESEKDVSGVRTASTEPTDKVRGIFRKRSWKIYEDRTVESLDDFIDVKANIEATKKRERDETAIDVISEGIRSGKHKRTELHAHARESGLSKNDFERTIKRYCQGETDAKTAPLWRNQRQMKNNASYYILLEND